MPAARGELFTGMIMRFPSEPSAEEMFQNLSGRRNPFESAETILNDILGEDNEFYTDLPL